MMRLLAQDVSNASCVLVLHVGENKTEKRVKFILGFCIVASSAGRVLCIPHTYTNIIIYITLRDIRVIEKC